MHRIPVDYLTSNELTLSVLTKKTFAKWIFQFVKQFPIGNHVLCHPHSQITVTENNFQSILLIALGRRRRINRFIRCCWIRWHFSFFRTMIWLSSFTVIRCRIKKVLNHATSGSDWLSWSKIVIHKISMTYNWFRNSEVFLFVNSFYEKPLEVKTTESNYSSLFLQCNLLVRFMIKENPQKMYNYHAWWSS